MSTDTTTDTTPGTVDPTTLDGYEPEVPGETQREKRARKARNRRRAEKVQREQAAEAGPAPVGRPSKQGKRAASVTAIVTGVGIGVYAFDPFDGQVIVEGATDLGDALAKVAEKNAKVAKALDSLTEVSAWAEVGAAVSGIVLPIIRHHAGGRPEVEPERSTPAEAPAPPEARPQIVDDAPGFTTRQDGPNADVPTFTVRHAD